MRNHWKAKVLALSFESFSLIPSTCGCFFFLSNGSIMTCENDFSFNGKSLSCIMTVLLMKQLHRCWDPIYVDRLYWGVGTSQFPFLGLVWQVLLQCVTSILNSLIQYWLSAVFLNLVIVSMFLRWQDLSRVTICMENALGKTKSAEGRWPEFLDSGFSLPLSTASMVELGGDFQPHIF